METSSAKIQEFWQKIKVFADDLISEWGLIAIVLLVGLASFGLGRLSALEDSRPPITITQAPMDMKPRSMAPGGLYVASRSGSAYYYPWCAGATRILPSNQVWFQSEDAPP